MLLGGYALHYSASIHRTMTLTPEQIAELQEKADKADELEQRIAALAGNKQEVLDEKKQLQQRLKELEDADRARKQKELEDQGKLNELLEQARKNNEELQKQLEEKEQAISAVEQQRTKDRLRTDFMSGIAADVFKPEHLWPLFQAATADRDGKTVVTYKGAELSPSELPAKLRLDPDYAHHFRPGKKGGMGAPTGAPGGGGDPVTNPYLTSNVTAQIAMQLENPEEAAKLQREARAAIAAAAKR